MKRASGSLRNPNLKKRRFPPIALAVMPRAGSLWKTVLSDAGKEDTALSPSEGLDLAKG